MPGSKGQSRSYDSSQIMLAELQNHIEEFRRSEQLGENRLNIYLAIVTAVIGFLVYFKTQNPLIIFFACLATLIFGVLTLLRMVHRNLISHEEMRAANRIRRYFVDRDHRILKYLKYPPCDDEPAREWKWKNGGLVDTVVLLNCLLVAIIIATLMALRSSTWSDWFVALARLSGSVWPDLFVTLARLSGSLAPWNTLVDLLYSPLVAKIVTTLVILRFFNWSDSFILLAGLSGFMAAWIIQIAFVKNEYGKARRKIEARFPCWSQSISEELEISIVIASDDPKSIADEIKQVTSIGGYILCADHPKNIHDIYFDTENKDLKRQKLALRIRKMNDDMLLTFKGPSVHRGEAMQRMEIEREWSHEAFEHVLQELRNIKVPLGKNASRSDTIETNASQNLSDITEVMYNHGLREIQDRETSRTIRNVVSEKNGPILAELAIDRVCYHFNDENIGFYEVEIENKFPDDGSSVIGTVGSMLRQRYPQTMIRWTHSKLEIGRAIEEIIPDLHKGNFLEIISDKEDRKPSYLLRRAAFDEIDRHIREKEKEMQ
jgi:predicted adenylyl cyclase CyaB